MLDAQPRNAVARVLFRTAFVSMLLGVGLVFLLWFLAVPLHQELRVEAINSNWPMKVLFASIGFAAVFSANILFWGMLVDTLISGRRPIPWRIFWFVIILLTNLLGASIYYIRVFNDSQTPKPFPKVAV
jgi:hypothetical protein